MSSILGTALQGHQSSAQSFSRSQVSGSGGGSNSGSLLGACPQPVMEHQSYQMPYQQHYRLPGPLSDGDLQNGFGNNVNGPVQSLLGSVRTDGQPGLQFNHSAAMPAAMPLFPMQSPSSTSILGSVGGAEGCDAVDVSVLPQQRRGASSLLGSIHTPASASRGLVLHDPPASLMPQSYLGAAPMTQGIRSLQSIPLPASAGVNQSSLLGSVSGAGDDFLMDQQQQQQYFRSPGVSQAPSLMGRQAGGVGFRGSAGAGNSILGSAAAVDSLQGSESLDFGYQQQQQTQSQQQQPMPLFPTPLVSSMAAPSRGITSTVPSSIPSLLGPLTSVSPLQSQNTRSSSYVGQRPAQAFGSFAGEMGDSMSMDVSLLNEQQHQHQQLQQQHPQHHHQQHHQQPQHYQQHQQQHYQPQQQQQAQQSHYQPQQPQPPQHHFQPQQLQPPMGSDSSCTVVIENLSSVIGVEELKNTLYRCCSVGPPLDVQIPWPSTARLIFSDPSVAIATVRIFDGQQLHGHILRAFIETLPTEINKHDGLMMSNQMHLQT